jgi:uncharacterized delta-60 repeat protein
MRGCGKGLTAFLTTWLAVSTWVQAGTNGLDASFGTGGIALFGATSSDRKFDAVTAIKVRPDGKIVLLGRASESAFTLAAIGRLASDGTWDEQFADHGMFVLPVGAGAAANGAKLDDVGLLSGGGILASGGAYQPDTTYFYSCTVLIKLTDSGALDTSFAADKSGTFCFDFAPSPVPLPGWFRHYDGLRVVEDDSFYLTSVSTNLTSGAVAHLDATGELVGGFGQNGVAALPADAYSFLIPSASSSQVLTAGITLSSTQVECAGAAALAEGGAFDLSYGTQGRTEFDCGEYAGPKTAAVDRSGRLLIASNDAEPEDLPYRLYRFTAQGQLDPTFNPGAQPPDSPGIVTLPLSAAGGYNHLSAASPLTDGHILVIGNTGYAAAGDGAEFNITFARLNEDASFDATFGSAAHPGWTSLNIGGAANSSGVASALALDANGRAYVAISTSDANGNFCSGVMRLIPDRLAGGEGFESASPMPVCPTH